MTWSRPWSPALAATAALAAVGALLPAPLAVAAIAVTFGFTPGWIVARHLAPGSRPAWRSLVAMVLSPLLVGGPGSALLSIGLEPRTVAIAIATVIAAAALVPSRLPAERDEPETAVPWIAGFGWAAIVVAMLLGNAILLTRADGWFHAAVVLQIAQRGLPVEDPFFAGLKLLYFWGYHVRAALWLALAPGLSVWAPLMSPQVAGAIATMLGIALLAQRLGAGARGQAVAVLLTLCGYVPFGWLWLALRVVTGDVRGMDEVRQLLTRGVEPVLSAMNPGTLHTSLSFFGDKYFIPTPFALGFAAFLAFTLLLLEVLDRPRLRTWVLLALVQAASLFLHSVVGWANALMAAGWGVWALLRARHRWESHLRLTLVGLAAAGVAAVVMLFPYLAATSAGKQQEIGWGLTAPVLRTWLLAGGLYVVPGMLWLARRAAAPGPARELWGFAVALTLAALLLGLPLANQSKLFNLLFLLLAAPAALKVLIWYEEWRGVRRALLVGGLVLATVPTVALALWGFASEARQLPFASEAPRHVTVREAYEWAARNTAPNAVFVDPEEKLGMAVVAGRSTLWGGERWAGNWGYDPASLDRRRRAVEELARSEVSEDTRLLIRELARPLVLVHRRFRAAGDSTDFAGPPVTPSPALWEPLYENEGVTLYTWKGGR